MTAPNRGLIVIGSLAVFLGMYAARPQGVDLSFCIGCWVVGIVALAGGIFLLWRNPAADKRSTWPGVALGELVFSVYLIFNALRGPS
jgi:hypothetical protein